jgi:hypothetical protein
VAPPSTETFEKIIQVDEIIRTEGDVDGVDSASTATAATTAPSLASINSDSQLPENVVEQVLKAHTFPSTCSAEGATQKLFTTAYYIAIGVAPFDPTFKGPRRLVLDRPVSEFKYFIGGWEKLTPGMHLLVRDIKRESLPEYCFGAEGRPEVFPVTRVKKRAAELVEDETDGIKKVKETEN